MISGKAIGAEYLFSVKWKITPFIKEITFEKETEVRNKKYLKSILVLLHQIEDLKEALYQLVSIKLKIK